MRKRLSLLILISLAFSCTAAMKYVQHRRTNFRASWQPTEIANMIAWYDASAITDAEGTAIATWQDSGPNGYDLYQSVVPSRAYVTNNVGQINNKNFLYFDGANDFYTHGASTVYTQPNTFFVVYNCHGGATAYFIYDGTNSTTRNTSWDSYGTQIAIYGGASLVSAVNSKVANQWFLTEDTYNGASSGVITNEVTYLSGNAGSQSLSGLCVGHQFNNTYRFKGGIAEVIIYNANVSAGDRALLRQYFKGKYGPYASW